MSSFNIKQVRCEFPALQNDQIFLDNAGGSQILLSSIEAICSYCMEANVQPVGATYEVEKNSTERNAAGYHAAAEFLNAEEDEIAFGGSATQLFRTLSQSLKFQPGDELIISSLEHEANIAPWVDVAERQNLTLKWWKPEPTCNPRLTLDSLNRLLSPKTKLVACTHANNVIGTINDIEAIVSAIHAIPGAFICVDGVAYAPHRPVDVNALGVDFYTVSWYKLFGPHCATMYASRKAQASLQSLGHYFNPHTSLKDKFTFGSGAFELIAGIKPIVDYLRQDSKWKAISEHEAALQTKLLHYLRDRSDITIYGDKIDSPKDRLPIVSFTIKGWRSKDAVLSLMKGTKLGLRAGNFYAYRLMETLQLDPVDAVVRISLLHYNSSEEIDCLIGALEDLVSRRGN